MCIHDTINPLQSLSYVQLFWEIDDELDEPLKEFIPRYLIPSLLNDTECEDSIEIKSTDCWKNGVQVEPPSPTDDTWHVLLRWWLLTNSSHKFLTLNLNYSQLYLTLILILNLNLRLSSPKTKSQP